MTSYMVVQPLVIASCPWRHRIIIPATAAAPRTTMTPTLRHDWFSGKKGVLMGRMTIKCMANPRRVKMVGKQIQRELSDMLLTDKVLQYAVLPEASLGADRYLSSLTTITDVQVSTDLQVVKVYVSVFGDERGKDVAIAGLKSKAKYVRSELGRRMKLRLTPEIRFLEDESFERASRVIAILDKIKDGKSTEGQDEQLDTADEDDNDLDGEDPDEGIIYVE
ncbi:unnamed protein product [Lupinus luteus]|uniref:Ribosome-binding factor A n=1 Tax=Lupinus luteus TaxID=3873 RepID=A0AAV1WVZ3_LUPLU